MNEDWEKKYRCDPAVFRMMVTFWIFLLACLAIAIWVVSHA